MTHLFWSAEVIYLHGMSLVWFVLFLLLLRARLS